MNEINNRMSANDQAGSIQSPGNNPNNIGGDVRTGQDNNSSQVDYKAQYEALEQKFGSQGRELGEFRSFFDSVSPLLGKLDVSPKLVEAILAGKIDENLAEAAIGGKITIGDAKTITQAHAEVKKELGNKGYDKTSPEDIAALIEEKVNEVKREFGTKLTDIEEARSFEQSVNDFIARTPDFSDYAKQIDEWLDAHKSVDDIEVAYFAVKGQLSTKEAKTRAEIDAAERAKDLALNAGGGRGNATYIPEGSNAVDVLIAGKSNPNVF